MSALKDMTKPPVTSMSVASQQLSAGSTEVASLAPRRYEVQDHGSTGRRVVAVSVVSVADGWRRMSDGTEVNQDGRVRRLGLGNTAIRSTSRLDQLFRVPLVDGAGGLDTVEVITPDGRSVAGRWQWSVKQVGAHLALTASLDVISYVVSYRAWYSPADPLPERYEIESRYRMGNQVSQNFTARQIVTN